jgi:CRP-like cAMP-binding protein
MPKWPELIEILSSEDLEIIMSLGSEQSVPSNTPIVQEDCEIDCLHFILKGLFKVSNKYNEAKPLTLLGPGEIIGGISFINNSKANVAVTALEDSLILTIPHEKLNERIENDSNLGLRLYKALARMIVNRLRNTKSRIGQMWAV